MRFHSEGKEKGCLDRRTDMGTDVQNELGCACVSRIKLCKHTYECVELF